MTLMAVQSTTRPATSLRLLCDEAARHGISPQECLAGTSVTVAELDDPKALHSTDDELIAIGNLVRLAPRNVGLGYAVGRVTHVHAFGIWGFAILTSPTLREAIGHSIEFDRLSFLLADMTLKEVAGRGWLAFDTSGLPEPTRRYVLERHMAITAKFIRELIQQPDYDSFVVELAEDDPDYATAMAAHTPIPIRMGAAENAFLFPAALLDQPLPKSDSVSLTS